MPRVTITCPDRRGLYNGAWALGRHFPDGKTTLDLTDAEIAILKGEIERRETILTVELVADETPKSPQPPQPQQQKQQQQRR